MTTPTLFLLFVGVMLAVVLVIIARFPASRSPVPRMAALIFWLSYVGLVGYLGVLRNVAMRPPGPVFLFGPLGLFFIVVLLRLFTTPVAGGSAAIPVGLLIGVQSFRVIVELFIHALWRDGLVPRMLTYSGANVDIYLGATAPLVAWWATRGSGGRKVALIWNALGLCALANVVTRAILTSPGPFNLIHSEVPNLMIGTFPYMFIPGFFVPLALLSHLLAIRALSRPEGTGAR
jgi:hypothetical protein